MEMTTPATTPCIACGTTRGYVRAGRKLPERTRGLCERCKKREWNSGAYWDRPLRLQHGDDARIPTGIVTPQMLGITAYEIAERCAEAALELEESAEDALIWAEAWRYRRPEQFTPAAIAALYPDPAGLACSAWADDAARVAA